MMIYLLIAYAASVILTGGWIATFLWADYKADKLDAERLGDSFTYQRLRHLDIAQALAITLIPLVNTVAFLYLLWMMAEKKRDILYEALKKPIVKTPPSKPVEITPDTKCSGSYYEPTGLRSVCHKCARRVSSGEAKLIGNIVIGGCAYKIHARSDEGTAK